MGQIADLQEEHREWVRRNFPTEQKHSPLLGIMEEVGELAHAHLKNEQNVRKAADPIVANAMKADALGDIFIYMMSYCNQNDLDLETCVGEAWTQVKARDWLANPETGGTP
jgi:NTP pyrophosphatase (non-canonical NTP hydrolase)